MKDCFNVIIGYEEIKEELRIICDMLSNPDEYKKLGAKINEGLILSGRPGTGKTTLANCLIKSTGRNVFVCRKKASDGEFVKNIDEVFQNAKANMPSIVLLDDLDKFSDQDKDLDAEEFATVQSCIDEVRGMDVFVMATVNNIHKIPESLLRAGRLGKRIKVRQPKQKEAISIVKHYIDKLGNCEDIDATSIARMLDGESCAALENAINNAAMKAAFRRQEKITMQNMIDSCLDVNFDAPESFDQWSEETRMRVAYHEAGHALAAELLDPGSVSIASIRKTEGGDFGFVRYSRNKEKEAIDRIYYENCLKTSLAGKAATEIAFGESDIGVGSDIRNAYGRAEELADYLCAYGFQNWKKGDFGGFATENRDRTMVMIMERSYFEVKKLLVEHRESLDKLATALMEKTTLIYSDVQKICHASEK